MPIGCVSCCAGTSRFSAGMMTMGTLKELSASIKVGCVAFIWMTNVAASGASQLATLSKVLRWLPTLA